MVLCSFTLNFCGNAATLTLDLKSEIAENIAADFCTIKYRQIGQYTLQFAAT